MRIPWLNRLRTVRPASTQGRAALLWCWLFWPLLAAHGSALKSDEEVVFFPTLATRSARGWELELHGWVYESVERPILTHVLRNALGLNEETLTDAERAIFMERARLFLVDNERGKTLTVRVGAARAKLQTSQPNGHFQGRLRLTDPELASAVGSTNASAILSIEVRTAEGRTRTCPGWVQKLEETGWSVISDIDDTIKVSRVQDREALLRNTFAKRFQAVPCMAAVYAYWARTNAALFHYVSASPWQLYSPLAQFMATNGFPAGSVHLRYFRVQDGSFLDLFRSPEQYKLDTIKPLLQRFPKRRFSLVGDSGERDPEIYGRLARELPGQIAQILIRDVTGEPAESPRYTQAFQGLARPLWRIFRNPIDLLLYADPPPALNMDH